MAVTRRDDKDLLGVWRGTQEEGDDGPRQSVRVVQQVLEAEIGQ